MLKMVLYTQKGTEIGAFRDLTTDPGTPYRDMNRSIFFNPDYLNASWLRQHLTQ